jgi:nitrite reductase/ring-hydroxylating ferredoxin subunit
MADAHAPVGSRLPMVRRPDEECDACGSCLLPRREFMRLGLTAAAVALMPSAVSAAPLGHAGASGPSGPLKYPVPTADGVSVDRASEVILVRYQGTIAAFALSCPHQRSMLKWRDKDGIFRCTKHHSEYSPLGVFEKGRATRNMDRLRIQLVGNEVVVDPSTVYHSDDDAAGWNSAVVAAP